MLVLLLFKFAASFDAFLWLQKMKINGKWNFDKKIKFIF